MIRTTKKSRIHLTINEYIGSTHEPKQSEPTVKNI